jgi:hypothetical protein
MNMTARGKRASIVLAFFAFLSPLAAEDSATKATPTDKDAYVLFTLTYEGANYQTRPTVSVSGKTGERTLTYTEHRLSCGTHMYGVLTESTQDGVLSVKGSFAVKENPYKITKLDIDVSRAKPTANWTGYLVVDGKRVPMELVQ